MVTKQELEDNLNSGLWRSGGWTITWKKPAVEISPTEFLNFAERDLEAGKDKRNIISALSNIKRALDCQIEIVIWDSGSLKQAKGELWGFPKKIEFLKMQKIVAPRILEKINKIRNLLEHEFKMPSVQDVEDALDVVTLFISYVQRLHPIPSSMNIVRKGTHEQICSVVFDKELRQFVANTTTGEPLFSIESGEKMFDFFMKEFTHRRVDNLFTGGL